MGKIRRVSTDWKKWANLRVLEWSEKIGNKNVPRQQNRNLIFDLPKALALVNLIWLREPNIQLNNVRTISSQIIIFVALSLVPFGVVSLRLKSLSNHFESVPVIGEIDESLPELTNYMWLSPIAFLFAPLSVILFEPSCTPSRGFRRILNLKSLAFRLKSSFTQTPIWSLDAQ